MSFGGESLLRSATCSSWRFGSLRGAGKFDASLERCTSACSDSKNNHADKSGIVISQWERFPRSHQIGTGSFGNVFLCHDMLPGSPWYRQPVAVKAVPLDALTDSGVMLAMNEVAILRHLRHPNILHYIDSFMDGEKQMCLVSEYAEGGDLTSLLRRSWELSGGGNNKESRYSHQWEENEREDMRGGSQRAHLESGSKKILTTRRAVPVLDDMQHGQARPYTWIESYRITDIVRQCLEALSYLHKCYIIHRDVKAANVYITKNGNVKLGDFGASKLVNLTDPLAKTFIGTPFYLCPELCLGEPYSFGADVWALGVLTYEMYCLKLPFVADNVLAQIHVVTEGQYDREALYHAHTFSPSDLQSLETTYGAAFTQQEKSLHMLVVALVERMLVVDALERPSASQLLREFFFADPHSGSLGTVSRPISRESLPRLNSSNTRESASQGLISRCLTSSTESDTETRESTPEAAALIASSVTHSYGALLEKLPEVRRNDVIQAASRLASRSGCLWRDSSVLRDTSDAVELDDSVRLASHEVISETVDKIPWLRHAEAFSLLTLHEGHEDDVVQVDWIDEEHFSLLSPRKGRCFLSLSCAKLDDDKEMDLLETRGLTPMAAREMAGRGEDAEETRAVATPAIHTFHVDEKVQSPPGSVGRCQGLSTEALEKILRKKIMASYVHRQWRLKAMREAYAVHEEERSRLQAELNELYAKSFFEGRRGMMTCGEDTEMSSTMNMPEDLESTQSPHSMAPATALFLTDATLRPVIRSDFTKTAGFERTLHRLTASPGYSTTGYRDGNTSLLTNEVVRIARDAAAVAERCKKWAMQPPARLDFSKRQVDEVDRRSTSSVADSERGTNMEVYDTPVTLCIVPDEAYITSRHNSPPPPASGTAVAVGSLVLPMTVTMKPISRRTRLDGIVWRVKTTLKAHGLDHVLFFPLDIDNANEVDAEELRLRYFDRVGDIIEISEASDWFYVRRDWYQRKGLPWMQLYMVTQ
ncbi:serine/threonine protein kinase, putative [Trypanosoma cruzi marinkellei]|uniref:non-specific serine/threonine protein kinase n=1 Tax=Trypanosoma cruzi marinkellei TaxID=85056 RepID=K2NT09_TRYCR|nr:serine/threonine protein kinase, putative [Trypanosoma cruzi marinkellei]